MAKADIIANPVKGGDVLWLQTPAQLACSPRPWHKTHHTDMQPAGVGMIPVADVKNRENSRYPNEVKKKDAS